MAIKHLRVLLAEDDDNVREMLRIALEIEGCRVDSVASVSAAQQLLAVHQDYGVVIADWKLPDGDGTLIVDQAATLGAKTFVMTAYPLDRPQHNIQRHEWVSKPIRIKTLMSMLGDAAGSPSGPVTGVPDGRSDPWRG